MKSRDEDNRRSRFSGSRFIDSNHTELLRVALKLSKLADSKCPDVGEGANLSEELIDKLRKHFWAEEIVLDRSNWDGLGGHAEQHRRLLQNIVMGFSPAAMERDFKALTKRMQLALLEHELVEDQKYWGHLHPEYFEGEVLIKWQEAYETGNQQFDDHHRSLVNHINRMYQCFEETKDHTELVHDIEQLVLYLDHHFEEEERMMQENGLVTHQHVKAHQVIVNTTKDLLNGLKSGTYDTLDFFEYSKLWIDAHTKVFDKVALTEIEKKKNG